VKIAIFIPTYNRPLLYDFLLYTIKQNLIGEYDIYSYQRVTNGDYDNYYKNIDKRYNVTSLVQRQPEQQELGMFLKYICNNYDYIITFTDDALLYREINLNEVIEKLKETNSFSYSFRLSTLFFEYAIIKQDQLWVTPTEDNYYFVNYKKIIDDNSGNVNFDGKGVIAHFTYPFELTSSLYSTKDFLDVLNHSNCNDVWSLEYTGRNYVVKNLDRLIMIGKEAQSISIQWNGLIAGDNKIISDSELDKITRLKMLSCDYNFGYDYTFVEEGLNDCFITYLSNKKYIDLFLDIFKGRI